MRIANILPLFTLTLAACAFGTDDADGPEAILIASADRPSGSQVDFLTTHEGIVIVAEEWQVGSEPTLPPEMARDVDPRDYYLALTGEEAPDELAAAVEASGTLYRRFAPSELVLADGPRPSSFWIVTAAEFTAAICGWDLENSDQWCHVDQTAETKHKKHDLNGMSATACTVTGEVEFRIAIRERNDWDRTSYMVAAGGCKRYSISANRDFDGESWVMQVGSGDKYHHGGMRCWASFGLTCPVHMPTLPH
ncbi:MAG TPA: hypothetical protein VM261_19455 [Kofleriaceae bacterium]|nr:hypothetical protein [Kofleriaceae bacterium]